MQLYSVMAKIPSYLNNQHLSTSSHQRPTNLVIPTRRRQLRYHHGCSLHAARNSYVPFVTFKVSSPFSLPQNIRRYRRSHFVSFMSSEDGGDGRPHADRTLQRFQWQSSNVASCNRHSQFARGDVVKTEWRTCLEKCLFRPYQIFELFFSGPRDLIPTVLHRP